MPDSPIVDPLAWRSVSAPSLADLELLAREVFGRLPDTFRALCEGLVIQVDDPRATVELIEHALAQRAG